MQASKLPLRYWFIAIHLLTSTKKTFSALELQRQLGHKFYEPVWAMLHKLRAVMGKRDNRYTLDKIVELDEGFFSSVNEKTTGTDNNPKRGRGSQKKSTVLVMASTTHNFTTTKKHKKPRQFRYVRMTVIENLKGQTIEQQVKQHIAFESVVKTDNYSSYSEIKDHVWNHNAQNLSGKDSVNVLPWVHTMISNAKRNLLGIHHMVSKKYMQNYLNEFCYKVNRRTFNNGIFDRLMIVCVTC